MTFIQQDFSEKYRYICLPQLLSSYISLFPRATPDCTIVKCSVFPFTFPAKCFTSNKKTCPEGHVLSNDPDAAQRHSTFNALRGAVRS